MNSVEEIAVYKQDFAAPYGHTSIKTAATTYDFPEHPPKKEKKWSFGNLFRRKKKDESESSSDEERHRKSSAGKKKRKQPDKRKKPSRAAGAFDHIVVPPQNRGSYIVNGKHDDAGVLSDPSGGFASHVGRPLPRIPGESKVVIKQEVLTRNDSSNSHNSLGSVDSLTRKSRRDKAKARALARRGSQCHRSSSDEDSYSSSKFKSDESLSRQRDGSLCRKSRTARTERYIRRLSKDDESILNREAMQRQTKENWQLKLPEERTNRRSPIISGAPKTAECYVNSASQPNFSGLFTIPPSHSNYSKYRTPNTYANSQECNVGARNYTQPQISNCFNIRSLSCDANIHKSPSPESQPEVMHVQLPIGKSNGRYRHMTLVEQSRLKQPPPPPPRDPRRIISAQFDGSRNTYNDKVYQRNPSIQACKPPDFANHWHAGYRTASEDHIPTEPRQALAPRPSSVTHEIRQPRFIKRHVQESADKFQYLTEKKPRSRKPIFIQSNDKINSSNYARNVPRLDSQCNVSRLDSQSSLNFWKQKEREDVRPSSKSTSSSPQMFTAQTHVQSKIFLPSVLKVDSKSVDTVDYVQRESSPFKPISSPSPVESCQDRKRETSSSVDSLSNEFSNGDEVKRKSSNLEDALDELEAIYKSLHLGDEDLLERAEQRETSIAAQKLLDSRSESYPAWGGVPRGAMSDSGFSYEPYGEVPKRKVLKKSQTLDRRHDDMAYRKLNRDRASTINSPQATLASVSYLLASPVHGPQDDGEGFTDELGNEPDVTLDDVVYRNVKHANNSLKVVDPQPPFGIPIGPITPAPNSDYLHAVPESSPRYAFVQKKMPDVVKDDLAYRNLRKDTNALKDLENNNVSDIAGIRKKRAVRSLSANICNLINKDTSFPYKNGEEESEGDYGKTSLTDIADAMEIARQILKEKERRIAATKRAFLSDSETKYRKHGVASASSTETITESRLNFLNEMRSGDSAKHSFLQTKPPRGSTPDRRPSKDSTPIPASPDLKKDSIHSSFEDLLTALAVEARETSDRITDELNNLDEVLNQNSLKRKQGSSDEPDEIVEVSEHAKLCEKLLECVVESAELIAATKTESNPAEHVEHIETLIPESVANIVTTRSVEESADNPVDTEVHSASEHDYDNLASDAETIPAIDPGSPNKSPFEEHKAELIATFKELSRFNEELKIDSSSGDEEPRVSSAAETGGEECALEVAALPAARECAFVSRAKINISRPGVVTYTSNCDIFVTDDYCESDGAEYPPSSGFHSNSSCTESIVSENPSCTDSNYFSAADHSNEPADPIPSRTGNNYFSADSLNEPLGSIPPCTGSNYFSAANHSNEPADQVPCAGGNYFSAADHSNELVDPIPSCTGSNYFSGDNLNEPLDPIPQCAGSNHFSTDNLNEPLGRILPSCTGSKYFSGDNLNEPLDPIPSGTGNNYYSATDHSNDPVHQVPGTGSNYLSATDHSNKLTDKIPSCPGSNYSSAANHSILSAADSLNVPIDQNLSCIGSNDFNAADNVIEHLDPISSCTDSTYFSATNRLNVPVGQITSCTGSNNFGAADNSNEPLDPISSCTGSNYFGAVDNLNEPLDQIPSLLLESLKSPKLVTSVMRQASERLKTGSDGASGASPRNDAENNEPTVDSSPSSSSSLSSSALPRNDRGHTLLERSRSWYGDPIVLAFACSYGVACSYQLASLDVVAILGLLFVIISIAAALILER